MSCNITALLNTRSQSSWEHLLVLQRALKSFSKMFSNRGSILVKCKFLKTYKKKINFVGKKKNRRKIPMGQKGKYVSFLHLKAKHLDYESSELNFAHSLCYRLHRVTFWICHLFSGYLCIWLLLHILCSVKLFYFTFPNLTLCLSSPNTIPAGHHFACPSWPLGGQPETSAPLRLRLASLHASSGSRLLKFTQQ